MNVWDTRQVQKLLNFTTPMLSEQITEMRLL